MAIEVYISTEVDRAGLLSRSAGIKYVRDLGRPSTSSLCDDAVLARGPWRVVEPEADCAQSASLDRIV